MACRECQPPRGFTGDIMSDGKSKEDFRRRRLSLADQDPAELAKAAAAMQVSPAGAAKPRRRLSVSPEMGARPAVPVAFPNTLCGTFSCHGIEPGADAAGVGVAGADGAT